MKKRFKYTYFVSFYFKASTGNGNANIFINRTKKINTTEEITGVQDYIKETNKFDYVVINNFIKIKNSK